MTVAAFSEQEVGARESNTCWVERKNWPEWDAFVGRHPAGSVYALSAWMEALACGFGHIRGRILAVRDARTGDIRAGLPVYAVESWLLGKRLVSVPFASVCDPLVSSRQEFGQLWSAVCQFGRSVGARYTEVRAANSASAMPDQEFEVTRDFKHHYVPLNTSPEEVYKRFSRHGIRRVISRAQRTGVVVTRGQTEAYVRAFYELFCATRRRLALPQLPYAFIQRLSQALGSRHVEVFLARLNDTPVAALLILKFGDTVTAEFSGDTPNARKLGFNPLLDWAAIQASCEEGYKRYSFGRTAVGNEGLLAYKRHFGSVESDLFSFRHPKSAVVRSATSGSRPLYSAVRGVLRFAPTPLYKAIGGFCYRHLG